MAEHIPELETERLRLRPYGPGDASFLHQLWNDALVRRFISPGKTYTLDQIEAYLERNRARWREHGFGHLAVTLKATGEPIGYCGFQHVEQTQVVELLYGLGTAFWRQGYTTEAAGACLDWAYRELSSLDRLVALAAPLNKGSWRVMEKLGMRYEGMAHYYDAELLCYVMTREEYLKEPAP